MRSLFVFGLVLISVSLYAQKMEILPTRGYLNSDVSTIIRYPSLGDDIFLSTDSSEKGVCQAFGFQRAVSGSMDSSKNYKNLTVRIDKNGSVVSGTVPGMKSRESLIISEIICLNQIGAKKISTVLVKKPLHKNSNLPFSNKGNAHGICRALKFESGAPGAMTMRVDYVGKMLVVDEQGKVQSSQKADGSPVSGYAVSKIVCLK